MEGGGQSEKVYTHLNVDIYRQPLRDISENIIGGWRLLGGNLILTFFRWETPRFVAKY